MKRIVLALVLILAACGGGADTVAENDPETTEPIPANTADTTATREAPTEGTTGPAPEEPDEEPASSGDTGITLMIGDETWSFANAQCAFSDAPAGQPDSRWNVSAILNGSFSDPDVQVYVNWEDPDTYLTLYDVAADEEWRAQKDSLTIAVDGNDITASAAFAHSGTGETAQGSLSATCPSWYDAS